ncbi:MAG: universal stress protein [Chloroflexota bacterium]|nr:universal stress protein [Chloroflexota bacterium]
MEGSYERFIVPVAGTPADDRVLAIVQHLLPAKGATVTLLYVVAVAQSMPLDAELPDDIARGEQALLRAETMARQALGGKRVQMHSELLQARSVGAAVVDEAIERSADAIIMTSSVRRKHGRPTLGETVNYIMLNAPCEVIAVRMAPVDPGLLETSWR